MEFKCISTHCLNSYETKFKKTNMAKKITFHSFPNDPELLKQWLLNMKLDESWRPGTNSKICSQHFEDKYLRRCIKNIKLKHNAVPTIFKSKRGRKRKKRRENDNTILPSIPASTAASQSKVPRSPILASTYFNESFNKLFCSKLATPDTSTTVPNKSVLNVTLLVSPNLTSVKVAPLITPSLTEENSIQKTDELKLVSSEQSRSNEGIPNRLLEEIKEKRKLSAILKSLKSTPINKETNNDIVVPNMNNQEEYKCHIRTYPRKKKTLLVVDKKSKDNLETNSVELNKSSNKTETPTVSPTTTPQISMQLQPNNDNLSTESTSQPNSNDKIKYSPKNTTIVEKCVHKSDTQNISESLNICALSKLEDFQFSSDAINMNDNRSETDCFEYKKSSNIIKVNAENNTDTETNPETEKLKDPNSNKNIKDGQKEDSIEKLTESNKELLKKQSKYSVGLAEKLKKTCESKTRYGSTVNVSIVNKLNGPKYVLKIKSDTKVDETSYIDQLGLNHLPLTINRLTKSKVTRQDSCETDGSSDSKSGHTSSSEGGEETKQEQATTPVSAQKIEYTTRKKISPNSKQSSPEIKPNNNKQLIENYINSLYKGKRKIDDINYKITVIVIDQKNNTLPHRKLYRVNDELAFMIMKQEYLGLGTNVQSVKNENSYTKFPVVVAEQHLKALKRLTKYKSIKMPSAPVESGTTKVPNSIDTLQRNLFNSLEIAAQKQLNKSLKLSGKKYTNIRKVKHHTFNVSALRNDYKSTSKNSVTKVLKRDLKLLVPRRVVYVKLLANDPAIELYNNKIKKIGKLKPGCKPSKKPTNKIMPLHLTRKTALKLGIEPSKNLEPPSSSRKSPSKKSDESPIKLDQFNEETNRVNSSKQESTQNLENQKSELTQKSSANSTAPCMPKDINNINSSCMKSNEELIKLKKQNKELELKQQDKNKKEVSFGENVEVNDVPKQISMKLKSILKPSENEVKNDHLEIERMTKEQEQNTSIPIVASESLYTYLNNLTQRKTSKDTVQNDVTSTRITSSQLKENSQISEEGKICSIADVRTLSPEEITALGDVATASTSAGLNENIIDKSIVNSKESSIKTNDQTSNIKVLERKSDSNVELHELEQNMELIHNGKQLKDTISVSKTVVEDIVSKKVQSSDDKLESISTSLEDVSLQKSTGSEEKKKKSRGVARKSTTKGGLPLIQSNVDMREAVDCSPVKVRKSSRANKGQHMKSYIDSIKNPPPLFMEEEEEEIMMVDAQERLWKYLQLTNSKEASGASKPSKKPVAKAVKLSPERAEKRPRPDDDSPDTIEADVSTQKKLHVSPTSSNTATSPAEANVHQEHMRSTTKQTSTTTSDSDNELLDHIEMFLILNATKLGYPFQLKNINKHVHHFRQITSKNTAINIYLFAEHSKNEGKMEQLKISNHIYSALALHRKLEKLQSKSNLIEETIYLVYSDMGINIKDKILDINICDNANFSNGINPYVPLENIYTITDSQLEKLLSITLELNQESIQKFMKQFTFGINQPGLIKLKEMIHTNLQLIFDCKFKDSEQLYEKLKMFIKSSTITSENLVKIFEHRLLEESIIMTPRNVIPNYYDRNLELKLLTSGFSLDNKNTKSHLIDIAITGQPGVGKTELLLKYLEIDGNTYDHILWFNGNYLECEMKNLAMKLNIITDSKQVVNNAISQKIYDLLKPYKCIVVFDNVVKPNDIRKYLPSKLLDSSNIMIVVTSQYTEWECKIQIPVEVFTPYVSEEFFKLHLPNYGDADLHKIAEMLGHLPIALVLAISYIKRRTKLVKLKGLPFTLLDFIESYTKNSDILLQYKPPSCDEIVYKKTLYELYQFDSIPLSELAIKILNCLGYVNNNKIPLKLFEKLCHNSDMYDNALIELEISSLIKCENQRISVHPILQNIIRKKNTNVESTLSELLHIFNDDVKNGKFKSVEYEIHALQVWKYASNYSTLQVKWCNVLLGIVNMENIKLEHIEGSIKCIENIPEIEMYISIQYKYLELLYNSNEFEKIITCTDEIIKKIPEELKSKKMLRILYIKAQSLYELDRLVESWKIFESIYLQQVENESDSINDWSVLISMIKTACELKYDNALEICILLIAKKCNDTRIDEIYADYHIKEITKILVIEKKAIEAIRLYDCILEREIDNSKLVTFITLNKCNLLCSMNKYDECWNILIQLYSNEKSNRESIKNILEMMFDVSYQFYINGDIEKIKYLENILDHGSRQSDGTLENILLNILRESTEQELLELPLLYTGAVSSIRERYGQYHQITLLTLICKANYLRRNYKIKEAWNELYHEIFENQQYIKIHKMIVEKSLNILVDIACECDAVRNDNNMKQLIYIIKEIIKIVPNYRKMIVDIIYKITNYYKISDKIDCGFKLIQDVYNIVDSKKSPLLILNLLCCKTLCSLDIGNLDEAWCTFEILCDKLGVKPKPEKSKTLNDLRNLIAKVTEEILEP